MAAGDIWRVIHDCSADNRQFSFGLWYETVTPSNDDENGFIVAQAVGSHLAAELADVMSTECRVEEIRAYKRRGVPAIAGHSDALAGEGLRPGNTLPITNCLVIHLRQTELDAKYNNTIFISGQSVSDQVGAKWQPSFLTDQVAPLEAKILQQVTAVNPNTGAWKPVVVASSLAPPQQQPGAVQDLKSTQAVDRVMTQRRRITRVRGVVN